MAGMKIGRSLAAACGGGALIWAVIALFFTVRVTTVTGTLASGAPYATAFIVRGYQTIGSWVMVLATAAVCLASFDLLREKVSARAALTWGAFAVVLTGAAWVGGTTPWVAWLPGIPADIQHAIGTSLVTVTDTPVANTPFWAAAALVVSYAVILLAIFVLSGNRKSSSPR